jgi:hypothetical protein
VLSAPARSRAQDYVGQRSLDAPTSGIDVCDTLRECQQSISYSSDSNYVTDLDLGASGLNFVVVHVVLSEYHQQSISDSSDSKHVTDGDHHVLRASEFDFVIRVILSECQLSAST